MTKSKKTTKSEDKLFIIEAVSTFKIRYAIKAKTLEEAKGSLACEEINELDQEWLGETVYGGKEISEKKFLKEEFTDTYNKNWSDEQKLKMINK